MLSTCIIIGTGVTVLKIKNKFGGKVICTTKNGWRITV